MARGVKTLVLVLHTLFCTRTFSQHNSTVSSGCAVAPCRKILCLHGGGQTGPELRTMMADIVSRAGDSYEFVFLTAPYGEPDSALWIRDPPGGKGQPTVATDWDKQSLAAIDAVVAAQGPFYGLLGYSQGTAAVLSYLSHAPSGTFQVVLGFCAYVPTTHEGITTRINASGPYPLPAFVYMSKDDWIISNCQTNQFAAQFLVPRTTRATSSGGGHYPPSSGAAGFDTIFSFLDANHTDGSYTPPAPTPDELPSAGCESTTSILLRLYWWVIVLCLLCCCGCGYCCALCCCRERIPARCRCQCRSKDKDTSGDVVATDVSAASGPRRVL